MNKFIFLLIFCCLVSCKDNKNEKVPQADSYHIDTLNVEEKIFNPNIRSEKLEELELKIVLNRMKREEEEEEEEEEYWRVKREELRDSCFVEHPGSSIIKISIDDRKSVLNVLGRNTILGAEGTFQYLSRDRSQCLNLTLHPGAYSNQISIFEVAYAGKSKREDRVLNTDERLLNENELKTEKGVTLGMSRNDLIDIFGACYRVTDSAENKFNIIYRIESPQDTEDKYLDRVNMPLYYAEYDF